MLSIVFLLGKPVFYNHRFIMKYFKNCNFECNVKEMRHNKTLQSYSTLSNALRSYTKILFSNTIFILQWTFYRVVIRIELLSGCSGKQSVTYIRRHDFIESRNFLFIATYLSHFPIKKHVFTNFWTSVMWLVKLPSNRPRFCWRKLYKNICHFT